MANSAHELYIGILSGTSLDGLDLVLTAIDPAGTISHRAAMSWPLPDDLRNLCQTLCTPGHDELVRYGTADRLFATVAAAGVQALLEQEQLQPEDIRAIGSHGQTVRHHPDKAPGFSLQLGCPHTLAASTGIDVVAQFRQKDIALGGEGAPLAPAFHQQVFTSAEHDRVVVNIGGIANVTYLPADAKSAPLGFDTGPGNTLLDYWIYRHHQQHYDLHGHWAASGRINDDLLNLLLNDSYFRRPAPKSTGREYFTPQWLHRSLERFEPLPPADVQATLVELTVRTMIEGIQQACPAPCSDENAAIDIYVCGGGAHNRYLLERCALALPAANWQTTAALGIHPDWVEGALFAWLAWSHVHKKAPDLRAVTGASRPSILGAYYLSK
ncbi:anhydro-N-acetylmuramic acid kinase [Aliidiomarina haloalkalitolerans]|uniref:Anhydro-N-acetylmuramic acid kinase n=1 Tax=Aliidiomarina haloalkalitolerans TaxID=859059 RepID=A0A432VTJ3_9GAMM|nr:anhydro-N-acetylmuramic acid kinase [Aliidiomarina haloalkalitolerans]RUO19787.1 anhydro-N-acetylmuramic acid kinase [Aliidiomarina haloalkalitolerans]